MLLAERARVRVNRLVWGVSATVMVVVPMIAWVGGSNAGPITCVPPPAVSFPTTTTAAPNPAPVDTSPNSSPNSSPTTSAPPTQSTVDPVLATSTTAAPPDTGVPAPVDTGVPAPSTTGVASGGPVPLAAFAASPAVAPPNTGPVPLDTGVPASSTSAAPAADTTPPPPTPAFSTTTFVPTPVPRNCATTIERVSVDNSGLRVSQTQGIGFGRVSISADGRYVAFYSYDLLTPDASGGPNVYVRDRVQQTTTLVSNGPAPVGQAPNNMLIGMSADGGSVLFFSNETFGATVGPAVYRRDMMTGATTDVTPRNEAGVQALPTNSGWFLSASGHQLAFYTPGFWWNPSLPGTMAVFVENLDTATTEVVAQSAAHNYVIPTVSDDGRYVGYSNNESAPAVVVDRSTGTEVFSAPGGGGINVSPDGTKAAFTWRATFNSPTQVEVADIATGAVTVLTDAPANRFSSSGSTDGAWSPDSQQFAFVANYPVGGVGVDAVNQVFVRNLASGELFAAPAPGVAPDSQSGGVALANGSIVAFGSLAQNLVPDDGSGATGPPNSVPGFPGSAREDVYVQGPAFAAFALPTIRLTGRVDTPGLFGLAGVTVGVRAGSPVGEYTSQVTTDNSGRFETLVPANSSLAIVVTRHLPDGTDSIAVLENRFVGNADASFNFTLPEWVSNVVHLRGVGGGDVQGAEVQWLGAPMIGGVSPDGFPVRFVWMPSQLPCVTGPSGTCSLSALAGFTVTARASYVPPGSAGFSTEATTLITAPPSEFAIDLPFTGSVPSSGSVTGSVVVAAPAGMSISNVTVQTVVPDVLPVDAVSLTGAVSYQVDGVPQGGTADVVLVLPPGSNPTAVYKILGGVAQDVTSIATISGDTIVVHLTDGGLGDGDGVANGVIVDPIVPVRTQATTNTLVVVPPAAVYGEPVTLTAGVAPDFGPSPVDGTVDVRDGATVVCAAVPLVNGQATCTVPLFAGGSHAVSAAFLGSTYFLPSTSTSSELVVSPADASVALTVPATATAGLPVSVSATVSGVGATPTGSVSFTASNGATCSASLVAGAATCSLPSLAGGTATVVTHYGGSANHLPADSAPGSISVVAPPTTVVLTSSMPTTVTGQRTTFRAVVSNGAGRVANGTVRFFDGTTLVGSARVAAGTASLTTSFSAGDHVLTAVYDSSVGVALARSAPVTQHVLAAATATGVLPLPIVGSVGKPVTLIAAVVALPPGAGVPTGQVRFMDGTVVLGTANLSNGLAALPGVTFTRKVHAITAVYVGSTDFRASTSPSFPLVVR